MTHFDKITGLNFDGLKFLVVFGYPKVKHEVVMAHARKQYASDTKPLPKADPNAHDENEKTISEYEQLTADAEYQENGLTINERRYTDPRLETIRQQLSIEKLIQAVGRARLATWTDTTTLIFTNAPIPNVTARATLFSAAAFNLVSETPSKLPDATQRIADAETAGDIKAVMETQGVSERTARRKTKNARHRTEKERDALIIELHKERHSQREISHRVKNAGYTKGTSPASINKVITRSETDKANYKY